MKSRLTLMTTLLLVVAMVISGCSGETRTGGSSDNELDGTKAVFDEASGKYLVEADAKLRFSTDTDAYGEAIVDLWNKTYPDHVGVVEYVKGDVAASTDKLAEQQGEFADVFMAIDNETPRNNAHLLPFDAKLAEKVKNHSIDSFFKSGNIEDGVVKYVPLTYDGMAFLWNKTMLEALGQDTADSDGDGLPDAFDTWEEIFALSESWIGNRPQYNGNDVNVTFPATLVNQWSDYHMLTSMGWELFAEGDPLKPGYDKDEFKKGLEFILKVKEAQLSVEVSGEVTPAESMTWRWDDVLNNQIAPFGLVGTWMDIDGAKEVTGADFRISVLPTYEGNRQTPFVKTKGYVINAYTKYRSASNALVDLLYSKEGLQLMVDNSAYAPSLLVDSELMPSMAEGSIHEAFSKAFEYNYPEPSMTLPNAPAVKAMEVYYALISNAEKAIYSGEKTIDEAVETLISDTEAWYAENNKE